MWILFLTNEVFPTFLARFARPHVHHSTLQVVSCLAPNGKLTRWTPAMATIIIAKIQVDHTLDIHEPGTFIPPEVNNGLSSRNVFVFILSSWWLNQPIWKICSSNWIISPSIGVNINKYLKPPPSHLLHFEVGHSKLWSRTCFSDSPFVFVAGHQKKKHHRDDPWVVLSCCETNLGGPRQHRQIRLCDGSCPP